VLIRIGFLDSTHSDHGLSDGKAKANSREQSVWPHR
jgi:hypothetical protein